MSFQVYCCECGAPSGVTDCEVTATSPCMCEACRAAYLEEVQKNQEVKP